MKVSDLGIILVALTICTLLGFFSYWLYGKIWQDGHRNILALSAGTGNCMYVGMPVASAIFSEHTLNIFIIGSVGVAIYEASVGYYFCVSNHHSFKECAMKIIKLPILQSFIFGCLFSIIGFRIPHFLNDFVQNMKGTFSVLGMLTVGLALSKIDILKIDFKFAIAALISKFAFFPIGFNLFIIFDRFVTNWYNNDYYNALQLICMAPMATNTIIISSIYKIHTEKVAMTVLISLMFILIYMPLMALLMLSDV